VAGAAELTTGNASDWGAPVPVHVNRSVLVRRVGIVNDHEVVVMGLEYAFSRQPRLELVGAAHTVLELLRDNADLDIVLLDVELADGSDPGTNVSVLLASGARPLIFTGGDDRLRVDSAVRNGANGVFYTHSSLSDLVRAIEAVASGRPLNAMQPDIAAGAGDCFLVDAGLSAREEEVLSLYASGEKVQRVANRTGLATSTVREYVDRIRAKYALVGRAAPTKIDLFRRAVEDGLLPPPWPRSEKQHAAIY